MGFSPLALSAGDPGAYARRYEHGSCGLVAFFSRQLTPGRVPLDRALQALEHLGHRSGVVDGEGDGCGVLVDIPRRLWARRLEQAGRDGALVSSPAFAVGHLFLDAAAADGEGLNSRLAALEQLLARRGIDVLARAVDETCPEALGPRARRGRPIFVQLALWVRPQSVATDGFVWELEGDGVFEVGPRRVQAWVGSRLFDAAMAVEARFPEFQVVSMSAHTAVYKVRGDVRALTGYYPDLQRPEMETRAVIGHNRYSTNTTPTFDRAQPFSLLAHNGEINTIRRLCMEAQMLGVPIVEGGSDSQNLNRTLDALIHRFGFSLPEAMEILFPPILNEVKHYPPELQDVYMYFRQAWGPFAQGPAAIFARHRHDAVMSVDALGLRPLWFIPTPEHVVFASEPGIVPTAELIDDPKPLAPGEKMAVHLDEQGLQVIDYPRLQEMVAQRWLRRVGPVGGYRRFLLAGAALKKHLSAASPANTPAGGQDGGGEGVCEESLRRLMAAWAWQDEDLKLLEEMARSGAEVVGSLGYDAPLAALSPDLHNLSDYFKETVAVVTNPAIDREREIEHFSTRVVVGRRPPVVGRHEPSEHDVVELRLPIVVGGHPESRTLSLEACRAVAGEFDSAAWADLLKILPGCVLKVRYRPQDESLAGALKRLSRQACEAASLGVRLIVLDDGGVFSDEEGSWIDPHLAVAAVDAALRRAAGLRRRVGLLVRSGAMRNLHDVVLALGMGADAVCPWLMLEMAGRIAEREGRPAQQGALALCSALNKGLEKVISTLGIHEIRGYARLVSAIGLKPELARVFEVESYGGSEQGGIGFAELEAQLPRRQALADGSAPPQLVRPFRYYPRVWKGIGQAARGELAYRELEARMAELEEEHPVSLRHLLELRASPVGADGRAVDPRSVDISVGEHAMPFVIASMSFGSQSEAAYRAYLEAARRADIVCLNGEGGEIPALVGRYPKHRGIQVASGRFGVHAEMLNGAWVIEIKIGQGAKPGEGGHLPGRKVSEKVARARNARPGIDLISPSNNHDIYSIEDLAQLVEELKTVSPHSRIAVKVPVVPGIGTIAVGIAKAGADIVNLSGFDGGTGAARMHAIRHVGLPAEIGVVEAHRALVAAGIRDRVEIWADGGMKSALDTVKMMLLGANRVGFGTLAMVAIGCTICRGCQLDTCHVGIATQIETREEAALRNLKRFVPRDVERAAEHLCTLLQQMGEALREWVAHLGVRRAQDLVGRSDLLVQASLRDRVDLSELLQPARAASELVPVRAAAQGEALEQREQARSLALSAVAAAGREREARSAVGGSVGGTLSGNGRHCGSGPVRTITNPRAEEQLRRAKESLAAGEPTVSWEADDASCCDRVLATPIAGQLARLRIGLEGPSNGWHRHGAQVVVRGCGAVGNGAGAFNVHGVEVRLEGGAQDGAAKCALGGRMVVLKARGAGGRRVNGSVGKSFAYGAQRGRFFVQGEADSRAAIRLSGADVVFGAMPRGPVVERGGNIACRAQLKGFAFEYMTNGRAVVLGDPGPWICSGMTGGVVYLRKAPEFGLDEQGLRRRIAKGARVQLVPIDDQGEQDIRELLRDYAAELRLSGQEQEAERVEHLAAYCRENFMAVRPAAQQTVQEISTE